MLERLKLLFRFSRILLFLPLRLKKGNIGPLVINGGNEELQKERTNYLKEHTEHEQFQYISIYPAKIYYDRLSFLKLIRISWLIHVFWWVLLLNLFTSSRKENAQRLINSFFYLLQIWMYDKGKKVFCLQIWMPESYIVSNIAAENGYDVTMITSSSPLHCNNRYVYAPKVKLAFASKFQKEELRIFTERNHFQVSSIEKWGPENVSDYSGLQNTEKEKYHLGLYSGGSWARDSLNLRISDIDSLKSSPNLKNPYYQIFRLILEVGVELKKEFGIEVIIFPHPHERQLLASGVEPPYSALAQSNNIPIDTRTMNSVHEFYNTKVGVSVVSTSIFDRINLELPGFVYGGDKIKRFMIAPHYLGSYEYICFKNKEDLREKVLKELALLK